MAMLGTPDDEKPKPPPRKPVAGGVRRFEDLTPKNQTFVRDNYAKLLLAHEKKDYQTMFDRARQVLTLVDEYNDTKSYEQIAKRGLDQAEEEKKRKELEEKQRKVREEVARLEEKGQAVFERAMNDPKARNELDGLIQEIYSKDPNNRKAVEWKAAIKEKIEAEKQAEKLAREREELRQRAEDEYARVEAIFKEGKYIEAIKEAEKLTDVGWNEKDYLEKVEKLQVDVREKLRSVLEPLLAEARIQRGEGGDLVKAREKYDEVLRIDKTNTEALSGRAQIREVLELRAKRLYAEAILAESVNDLAEAKEKYEKCWHTAPDETNIQLNRDYRARCKRKLERFDAFTPESAVKETRASE